MKVVIFDMDGTIINSSKAIGKTINSVRQELGLDALSEEFIVKTINEPNKNLAYEFYGINNPTGSFKEGFEDKFKKNYDLYAETYSGIKELLKGLKDSGYKVALASNAPAKTLEQILKRNEIFDFFDMVVGADDEIPPKPDPTMLNLVCDKLGATKAIFVGDSLKDESAAINAKMPYIHVNWGFGTSKDKDTYKADKADDVLNIVKSYI